MWNFKFPRTALYVHQASMAYTSADFAKEVLVVPSSFRPGLAILAAALLTTSVALAFNAPLSDEAVREAYFLGQRHDDTTARFLETYRRYFPVPESGPHVLVVELFTPYAQAVESSSKQGAGYSAQQAIQDYQVRGDSLRVSVHVRYTSTHGAGFPYSQNIIEFIGRTFRFDCCSVASHSRPEA